MNKLFVTIAATLLCLPFFGQEIRVASARFSVGDNPAWAQPSFDDSAWPVLRLDATWDAQGYRNDAAFGWYRLHVTIPSALKKGTTAKILLDIGPVDDTDETFLNGVLVGKTGSNPGDPAGYVGKWTEPRRYVVDPSLIRWDRENVIAVRVYNAGGVGGFYAREPWIGKPELRDLVTLKAERRGNKCEATLSAAIKTEGTVTMAVEDVVSGEILSSKSWTVKPGGRKPLHYACPMEGSVRVRFTYTDSRFDDTLEAGVTNPYILTPPAPAAPRYNGPLVFGVRPGSPVIFRLAFSGEKPMKYAVEGLPEGLALDPETGVLSGSVGRRGDYPLRLKASNASGSASADFTLKVGDKIALTPPMGWNSWNCWGLSVSQEKVMASVAALLNTGLADYGYSYINIDDAWEAEERNPDGTIATNEKFPDMKALADWLHARGLKMGIYSSPGDRTCGGYLGTLGHEEQDAKTWNDWGVDYLKYDWCGYSKVFDPSPDHSVAAYMRPYVKMQQYLREQPRDIFYSLCQYGMARVWEWGAFVDANSWRTTGDITDTWESLHDIGFVRQRELHPYAGPGHWNDPDMLVVGKVGWSDNLRDSRLTPDEQYTHISLWALLAANMLIGCDLAQIDDFTLNLLCNNEVNAVNQDVLGIQARQDLVEDGMQIWSRPLADGTRAIGIFNLNDVSVPVYLKGALEKVDVRAGLVRDLWRQADIPADATYLIPPHGVRLLKVSASHGSAHQPVTVSVTESREPVEFETLGHNPICPPGVYMADPSARVMDGRLYLACSTDISSAYWCSPHHHMLSSPDALHWTLHPNTFASAGPYDGVPYADADLYAPDVVEKDGRYYLYYDMSDWTEGVAVGDSPTGPFRDGVPIAGIRGIDPCVFIDDDGQAYYFWDQFSAQGAKLNPDMKSLDMSTLHRGIVTEAEHGFHEGSYVFKRDGWYYFVYADVSRQNMPTSIGYSMSRNIFGPYEYKGVILDSNGCDPGVWNNHGSVVQLGGQWYVLYHRSTHHGSKLRKACIEPIRFNPDGTIPEVEMTSQGAGAPLEACDRIDAYRACLVNGGPHIRLMEGRSDREILSGAVSGSKAAWKYLHFPEGVKRMTVRVRALAGGRIEVKQGQSFGRSIASLEVPAGEGEWVTLSCEASPKSGVHALWFLFGGPSAGWNDPPVLFELDWIRFEKND